MCQQDDETIYSARPADAEAVKYSLFGTINAHSGVRGPGWEFRTWFDNLLVSSQQLYPSAVIEVCDRATYAGAKCQWQAPVFISDTTVQFTFDKGKLSCKTCYLYVRNNKQQQSAGVKMSL